MSKSAKAETHARELNAIKAAEAARIAAAKMRGAVPPEVGPDVIEAPARGPVRMSDMRKMVRTESGGMRRVHDGHQGRKTLHCADAFDVMEARARAAHTRATSRAKAAGKDAPVWAAPFTPGQIAMGRHYRTLAERHACAGVKCSSLESLSQSGGTGGDFMDAVLADGYKLDMLHRRIGEGSALVVRRNRPSARGSRLGITDRRLVDMVCLEDGALSDVLTRHGWAINAKLVGDLQKALGAALDRMNGPVSGVGIVEASFG
ncbi:MAG: hypothetical protein MK042_14685 [Cognatishimia sp.]|nr:hypothetical protein [Cognatishimia sp.]